MKKELAFTYTKGFDKILIFEGDSMIMEVLFFKNIK